MDSISASAQCRSSPSIIAATSDDEQLLPHPRGFERNGAWGVFLGAPTRARHTQEEQRALEIGMVPELRAGAGVVGSPEVPHKAVDHPQVGLLTLDCNVLRVDGSGLRILGYSAEPGSESAEKPELLSVIGMRSRAK
ncbi:hypothetical protein [Streptomyces sp. NPDC056948]|uniref:MmyB family transcriptional regulator n=1 Tax=Streptomyces sp. NPDC056948 TaxID=3345975 RepID=UPI003644FA37